MPKCEGCDKVFEEHILIEGFCAVCRDALGLLLDELPVLRPAGPCRRCSGQEIVQALLRERGAEGCDHVYEFLRPLAVSHGVEDVESFWSGAKKGVQPNLEAYTGALVAYVCRSCGFTELFAASPGEIPIGPQHGTRLLRPNEGAPYR